jgi:tetratricopeptide (TPR) repeat protein
MKKYLAIALLVLTGSAAFSQSITLPPSGGNQKSSVTQWIGPVSVTINYSSPNVTAPNGEDRKGKIWGGLVHYGLIDQQFGSSKAAPYRAGANENTTIAFSHDVKINGQDLKAGTYGLFLIAEKEGPYTWIFSKNSESWGSYFYDPKEDALRTQTTPAESEYTEYLTFGFDTRELTTATAYMQWENKRIPLKIDVPNVNELYLSTIRNELRNFEGFDYENVQAAVNFCVQNKINLEEALTWADYAISSPVGVEDFGSLRTKASVLNALNRETEAEAVMQKAMNHPTADVTSIHQYGRMLLQSGKKEKALEVFKVNRQRHPEDKFTTFVGLARGYTAVGDNKNAIKNWEMAIKGLPENQKQNLAFYEGELKKLKG